MLIEGGARQLEKEMLTVIIRFSRLILIDLTMRRRRNALAK